MRLKGSSASLCFSFPHALGYSPAVFYIFAILGLGLLVTVHEAGHMIAARLCGMRVDKFSIFFGPVLMRWRGKATVYQLATVPLGGYVQIAGMSPEEILPEGDPGSYQNKGSLARFFTIFAGPGVNYLFAFVLMLLVTLTWGTPESTSGVMGIQEGKPAALAGMKAGDHIVSIGGVAMTDSLTVRQAIAASEGKAVDFVVRRDGQEVGLSIQPEGGAGNYKIGIEFSTAFKKISAGDAIVQSFRYPIDTSAQMLSGLGHMLGVLKLKIVGFFSEDDAAKKAPSPAVGGPVEIIYQMKSQFERGLPTAITFLAMLNVLLGLFNLLPIPALDGGRLVFIVISMITRRKINPRVETMIHTVGFYLLFGILILATYGDIKRRFFGS